MCTLIKESEENKHVKKSQLYLALGKALVAKPPPQVQTPNQRTNQPDGLSFMILVS